MKSLDTSTLIKPLELFIVEMRRFISTILKEAYGNRWPQKFCNSLDSNQQKGWLKSQGEGIPPKEIIDFQYLRPFASTNQDLLSPYFDKRVYHLPTWFDEICYVRNLVAHFRPEYISANDISKAFIHMISIAVILELNSLKDELESIYSLIKSQNIDNQKISRKRKVIYPKKKEMVNKSGRNTSGPIIARKFAKDFDMVSSLEELVKIEKRKLIFSDYPFTLSIDFVTNIISKDSDTKNLNKINYKRELKTYWKKYCSDRNLKEYPNFLQLGLSDFYGAELHQSEHQLDSSYYYDVDEEKISMSFWTNDLTDSGCRLYAELPWLPRNQTRIPRKRNIYLLFCTLAAYICNLEIDAIFNQDVFDKIGFGDGQSPHFEVIITPLELRF